MHHPVVHPQKAEKVRVVFDCAAKYGGTSLNDMLLQGPDLTNTLVGVLTRFRQESTAVMADIESMYYQVHVREEDSDYLTLSLVVRGRPSSQTRSLPYMRTLNNVDTKANPADDASRGLTAEALIHNKRWIEGPAFLWSTEDNWPQRPKLNITVSEEDPEVKRETKIISLATNNELDPVNRMIQHFLFVASIEEACSLDSTLSR
jgi:hypothetical protein